MCSKVFDCSFRIVLGLFIVRFMLIKKFSSVRTAIGAAASHQIRTINS